MTTNALTRLRNLLPPPAVLIGRVVAHHAADDTSTIEIALGIGLTAYVAGLSSGSLIRPRGRGVPVGKNAFVRSGVVETQAPDGAPLDIVLPVVSCAYTEQTFSGPITNQNSFTGVLVALDVSGFFSGGFGPYTYGVVGVLPAGLTIDPLTGVISGTPTTAQTLTGVVISVSDATGRSITSNAFDWSVAAPTALSILHFEGAPGTTTYTDEVGPAWDGVGFPLPVLSSDQKLAGSTSLRKTAAAFLSAIQGPAALNPHGYLVGAGLVQADFTIRISVRLDNVSGDKGLFSNANASSPDDWNVEAVGNQLRVRLGGTNATIIPLAGALVANTWHEVALCRAGDTLKLVLDQVVLGTTTYTRVTNNGGRLHYGCSSNTGLSQWAGYLDEAYVVQSPIGGGGCLY